MTKTTTLPPRLYTYRLQDGAGKAIMEYQVATQSMEKACLVVMEKHSIRGSYQIRKNFADIRDINGSGFIDWRVVRV